MEEKDIEKMTDEELKEYTRNFYERLEDKASCATCPNETCPGQLRKVNKETDNPEKDE